MPPFSDFPAASKPVRELTPEIHLTVAPEDRPLVTALSPKQGRDFLHGSYGGLAALQVRAIASRPDAPEWATTLWKRVAALSLP